MELNITADYQEIKPAGGVGLTGHHPTGDYTLHISEEQIKEIARILKDV